MKHSISLIMAEGYVIKVVNDRFFILSEKNRTKIIQVMFSWEECISWIKNNKKG